MWDCNAGSLNAAASQNDCFPHGRVRGTHLEGALTVSGQSIEGALGLSQGQASAGGNISHSHSASQALHRILNSLPRLPGDLEGLQLPQSRTLACWLPCTSPGCTVNYRVYAARADMPESIGAGPAGYWH